MWFNFLILGLVVAQRLAELAISMRNARRLLDRGAYEVGAGHYPLFVILHAAWLLGLFYFTWGLEAGWPWLVAYLALQAARGWVIAALGERWTTRIIVLPDEPLVKRGPYRLLRHPNYLVVAAEIFILPMVWGLFWYALVFSILNAALIAWRIKVEEQALKPMRKPQLPEAPE
jgi:methyltransferase